MVLLLNYYLSSHIRRVNPCNWLWSKLRFGPLSLSLSPLSCPGHCPPHYYSDRLGAGPPLIGHLSHPGLLIGQSHHTREMGPGTGHFNPFESLIMIPAWVLITALLGHLIIFWLHHPMSSLVITRQIENKSPWCQVTEHCWHQPMPGVTKMRVSRFTRAS